jgi:uncharacterized protein YidB (DUF937 family)
MDLMNLAQQFLGSTMGQGLAAKNPMIGMALQMVQNYPGGLTALVQKFETSGMSSQVQSWISTNANQPVSGAQVQQAMGEQVTALAQQANMPQGDVANTIATMLPQLVDNLTPQGALPDHDAIASALNALKSKLAA